MPYQLLTTACCVYSEQRPIAEILSTDEPDSGKRRSPDPNAPVYGELIVLG